jgi:hypothetical protein
VLKRAECGSDLPGMGLRVALLLALLLVGRDLRAGESDTIGGREEGWWRAAMASREAEVAALAEALATCEEREAPPAYDAVEGYVTRSRRDGRPYFVEVKRCDAEREALAGASAERDRFEEEAQRLGVPPGWLR